MGYSALHANLLTIPPFVCGALMLWGMTYLSDRERQRYSNLPHYPSRTQLTCLRHRIKFILIGLSVNLVGLVIVCMLPRTAYTLKYLGLCILLSGSYIASPLTVAWLTGNIEGLPPFLAPSSSPSHYPPILTHPEPGKRAVVLGINGWGNLAGVLSSLLYAPKYAPDYQTPFVVTLFLVAVAFVGYIGFRRALVRENAKRERRMKEWTVEEEEKERRGAGGRRGDERWVFRYGL